jgi:hypothetical protein
MSKSTGFPFRLVFTDTAGREHAIGSFRTFNAAVALMEQKITPPFGGKPKFYLNHAAGYATGTVRGFGVYEVR